MNAAQHTSPGRLADLSPFVVKVAVATPKRVRNAECREFLKGGAETDSGYGCVDWYQYPLVEQTGPEQQQIEDARVTDVPARAPSGGSQHCRRAAQD